MSDVSLIIVNYNTRQRLLGALDSLAAGGAPGEVIVVDNASRDGSAGAAAGHALAPRVVARTANDGFAAGVNAGLKAATGRVIVLLNSDARVTAGALAALVDHLDNHPEAGTVGGRVLNPDGSRQPTAFSEPTLLDTWLEFGFLGLTHPLGMRLAPDATGPVGWVSGAFMAFPRELAGRLGGLDERYFLYAEDIDWCHRVRQAGLAVHYVTGATAVHEARGSDPAAGNWSPRAVHARLLFHSRYSGAPAAALLRAALTVNWAITLVGLLGASLVPGPLGNRSRRALQRVAGLIRRAGKDRA